MLKNIIPIIILNYNSYEHVKANIESALSNSSEEIIYKFIVIDNNSKDLEVNKIEQYLEIYDLKKIVLKDKSELNQRISDFNNIDLINNQVIFIKMKKNYGFSYSNNIGMRLSKLLGFKYCIVSNPDTRIIDNISVKKLYNTLNNNDDIAVAFPRVIDPNGLHQEIYYRMNIYSLCIYNIFYPILYIPTKLARKIEHKRNTKENYTEIYTSIGCFFMVDLLSMSNVDFLDENIFMYYEEDVISHKIKRLNKKLVCVNDSIILHEHIINRKQENSDIKEKSLNYFMKEYLMYSDFKIRACKFGMKVMDKVYAPIIDKINRLLVRRD